jgi:predicted dehydrogenase
LRKLEAAVVGLGRIGWCFHIPQIRKNDKFNLAAVVDPLEERREEAEREFNVKAFETMDAMLDEVKPDVVVIASPTPFHADQAVKAMESGIDVFCDKPMAMDLSEVDKMIATAEATGRKMMVYQPHRASSEALSLKALVAKGLIGEPYLIKRSMCDYRRRNDWQAFKKNGGGMIMNFGAHLIDQLLFLTDFTPVVKSHCALRTIVSLGDADDVVRGFFENAKGVILDFDINMAVAIAMPKWQIFGKYGTIVDEGKSWRVRYVDPDTLVDLKTQNGLAAEKRKYLADDPVVWKEETIPFESCEPVNFYDKLYDYIELDQAPYVPLTETREVMRLIKECGG